MNKKTKKTQTLVTVSYMESEHETHGVGECSFASTEEWIEDNTTLMVESEEELNSLLMKLKEESEKAGLKLSIQKTKIMVCGPITSWKIDGETMETVTDSKRLLGLQNHCRW